MEKFLEIVKKYKGYVIAGFIILLLVSYYFYQRSFGYFIPISLANIIRENEGLSNIYKSDNFYTLIDTGNNIYRFDIDSKLEFRLKDEQHINLEKNENPRKVIESGVQHIYPPRYKIYNIQINNGNILFYKINKHARLCLSVYNPSSNKIVNRYNTKADSKYDIYTPPVAQAVGNADILITTQDKKSKKTITEKYDSEKNVLIPIQQNVSAEVLPYGIQNVRISERENLFIKNQKRDAYIYDTSLNKLYQTDSFQPNKNLEPGITLYETKVVSLKTGEFLLVEYVYNQNQKEKEYIISKYEFKNGKFERVMSFNIGDLSSKYIFTNYTLTKANILPLNEDELLVTGGMAGKFIGFGEVKRAYIIDLKKQKVIRINDMNSVHSEHSSLLIDSNTAIIYNADIIVPVTEVEGFKRSRIW